MGSRPPIVSEKAPMDPSWLGLRAHILPRGIRARIPALPRTPPNTKRLAAPAEGSRFAPGMTAERNRLAARREQPLVRDGRPPELCNAPATALLATGEKIALFRRLFRGRGLSDSPGKQDR
jgi:hypothetical protein